MKEYIRINIDDLFQSNIPKILLIKDNKLTNKTIKTFKDIFDLFSIDEKRIQLNVHNLLA